MEIVIKLILGVLGMIIALNALLYGLSLLASLEILKFFGVNLDSLVGLSLVIVLASIMSFVITFIIYKLHKDKDVFKAKFEFNSMFNTYLWGLISLIYIMRISFISEVQLTESELKFIENLQKQEEGFAMLFFIILANHSLFTNIVLEGKLNKLFN